MRAGLLILAFSLAAAAGEDREPVRFHLKGAPGEAWSGWLLSYDDETLKFQRFGGGRRQELRWTDLEPADALLLRRRLGLELPEGIEGRRCDAHRVRFRSGTVLEGLLVAVDGEKRHWIKRGGVVMPYPGDQVVKVEETRLLETDVYGPEELYVRRLLDEPPQDAEDHLKLAGYLYDIGNFERAREHYEAAAGARPVLRPIVAPRLERIEAYLADAEAAEVFRKAKRRGLLQEDHEGAIALLEAFARERPDVRREALRIVDEIRERRFSRLASRFSRAKHEEAKRAVARFLRTHRPGCAEAMAWVERSLPRETEQRVRRRLRIDGDEYEALRDTPSPGAWHWATYWTGTFVVGKRTKGDEADPERWWSACDDTKRSGFLLAHAAEKLPDLFEVMRIRFTDCERCGGSGLVTKMSFRSAGGAGTNEWNEVCPRCHGNGRERSVGYR